MCQRSSLLVLAVLGALGIGCKQLDEVFGYSPPEPGIVLGTGLFDWEVHYAGDTTLVTLYAGSVHEDQAIVLCAGRNDGLTWLDAKGRPIAELRVEGWMALPIPLDLDGDGRFEVLDRGLGWSDVGVFNRDGTMRWRYPPSASDFDAPNDLSAVDLDGDGILELLCGLNGDGGLLLFDVDGELRARWSAGNVFTVAAVDADGDGLPEILHSSSGVGLVLRKSNGSIVRTLIEHDGPFCLTRWPQIASGDLLAVTARDTLDLYDLNGRCLRSLELPIGGHSVHRVLPIRFRANAASWLAAVRTYKATEQRSVFLLWRPNGVLAYAEVFPFRRLDIALVADGRGREQLLLAAGREILHIVPRH